MRKFWFWVVCSPHLVFFMLVGLMGFGTVALYGNFSVSLLSGVSILLVWIIIPAVVTNKILKICATKLYGRNVL